MIADGQDVDGEARLADALALRGAHPRCRLRAGPGGRALHALGHTVVGVDVDPHADRRGARGLPLAPAGSSVILPDLILVSSST